MKSKPIEMILDAIEHRCGRGLTMSDRSRLVLEASRALAYARRVIAARDDMDAQLRHRAKKSSE